MPTIVIVIVVIIILGLFASWGNKASNRQKEKEKEENPLLAYYKVSLDWFRSNKDLPEKVMEEKLEALAKEYGIQPANGCVSPPPYNESLTMGQYLRRELSIRYSNYIFKRTSSRSEYPLTVPGFDLRPWIQKQIDNQKNS